jgi:hypothetical protein
MAGTSRGTLRVENVIPGVVESHDEGLRRGTGVNSVVLSGESSDGVGYQLAAVDSEGQATHMIRGTRDESYDLAGTADKGYRR